MALSEELRNQIDDRVKKHPVVLFMKGNRQFPQCGFSARVVAILDELVGAYETVNVLADLQMRDGIKEYSEWPTIPQLYVDGKFIGGCDLVTEMRASGELQKLLGAAPAAPAPAPATPAPGAGGVPQIAVTAGAAKAFRDALLESKGEVIRLEISGSFQYELFVAPRAKGDVEVRAGEVALFLDPESARRASGVAIDFVSTSDGGAFKITSPHEPHAVKQITATELKGWIEQGRPFELFDVRPESERSIARIMRARPLDPAGKSDLMALDRKTPVVFHCHHGMRSRTAAESALRAGFCDVYNLEGGIDDWSQSVDPSVPRY